jgi:multidrug efflux system membrane fusion protein
MPTTAAVDDRTAAGAAADGETKSPITTRERWRGKGRWWLITIGLVLVIAAAIAAVQHRETAATAPAADRQTARAVPVNVATAAIADVPVRLSALGSVVAFNEVTVKPRVDGQLMNVAFHEGQIVQRGDLLAEIDPRPFEVQLEQAQGQEAKDQAQVAEARTELSRYQLLLSEDSIARTNVDTQAATVKQLEAALAVDQAAISAAKLNLSFTRVTAPIGGRVGLRQIDAGNLVAAANTPLVVVTQIQPIAVVFALPEDSLRLVLPRLHKGLPLAVDVFDRSGATHLANGTVLALDNQIDPATGTVKLKATFDNHDGALFPSQFVNVQVVADVRRNQVVVSAPAIQQGPQGAFVYVVRDRKAAVQPVTVGIVNGDVASIDRGLDAGTEVVVDGVDHLRDGAAVDVRSPATKNGRGAARPGAPGLQPAQ